MPPESSVRILFVGDMHLGRLPSRVPDAVLEQGGFALRNLGPGATWDRIVEAALAHQVHAVALAGDLVEGGNAMFEAYGPLATGVRRLVEQGIIVAAVAGNHDTAVLPRLADEIDRFHLLGPGGSWSTVKIPGEGGLAIQLAGWSFPTRHHSVSPLLTSPPPAAGVTFGLLHADLDAGRSNYAPVRSADLISTGYQGWFLGHVHIPGDIPADGAPFYLGSVTGLDPSETGRRGPVLVSVSSSGGIAAERMSLAPLRWEHREIDCTGLEDPANLLESHLIRQLSHLHAELEAELDDALALGVQILLTGTVEDPAALDRALRELELDPGRLVTHHEGIILFIQKISSLVSARIPLTELAGRADPPGLLARQILALENPGSEVYGVAASSDLSDALMGDARQALARVDEGAAFNPLATGEEEISDAEIRQMLGQAGRLALAGLLAQPKNAKETDRAAG